MQKIQVMLSLIHIYDMTMETRNSLVGYWKERGLMPNAINSYMTDVRTAKPVIEKLPGWKCDIRGIKNYEELPENCRKYIEFVEEKIGYPITLVSNGPGRDDIIYR